MGKRETHKTPALTDNMNEVKTFRELLSRSFATLKADDVTGEKEVSDVVTGHHYLAEYEIDKLVEALRKTVANQPQHDK